VPVKAPRCSTELSHVFGLARLATRRGEIRWDVGVAVPPDGSARGLRPQRSRPRLNVRARRQSRPALLEGVGTWTTLTQLNEAHFVADDARRGHGARVREPTPGRSRSTSSAASPCGGTTSRIGQLRSPAPWGAMNSVAPEVAICAGSGFGFEPHARCSRRGGQSMSLSRSSKLGYGSSTSPK